MVTNYEDKQCVRQENGWYSFQYWRPAVTTDSVIFAFDGTSLKVLLIQRGDKEQPFYGCWALPGGFIKLTDENIEECAERELREETKVRAKFKNLFALEANHLHPSGVYSQYNRDPRSRVITFAFYALVRMQDVHGGDDASDAQWFDLDKLPELAFDHLQILDDALNHLREDIHYRPVGFGLLPEEFTMGQLQSLYQAINPSLDVERTNFQKRMLATGFFEKVEQKKKSKKEKIGHCPAILYRFNLERYNEFKTAQNKKLDI